MLLKLEHKNESAFVLNKSLTFFMAVICGVTVANLYYIQPLEAQIATTFHVSENAVGIAVMLTQIGYALGLLLFVPLGDITERRTMIFRMLLIVAVALIATGWSPTYEVMLIATFTVGLTTIIPQLIVPYAAQLAATKRAGKSHRKSDEWFVGWSSSFKNLQWSCWFYYRVENRILYCRLPDISSGIHHSLYFP